MNPVTLTWRLLTADELTRVYLDEMCRDFPQSERKPLSMILTSEAAGTAHTWGVFDGEALAAYLLMVRPVGCAMSQLDYFAVRRTGRRLDRTPLRRMVPGAGAALRFPHSGRRNHRAGSRGLLPSHHGRTPVEKVRYLLPSRWVYGAVLTPKS